MLSLLKRNFTLSPMTVIICFAGFIVVTSNGRFFSHFIAAYPLSLETYLFSLSVVLVLYSLTIMLLLLFKFRYVFRPILIALILVSAFSAYFMDSYNTIIDKYMIQNLFKTDIGESLDLVSIKLVLYILFLGVIPSLFVLRIKPQFHSWGYEALISAKYFMVAVVVIAACVYLFSNYYASFFREHKIIREYSNPHYPIYSTIKFISSRFETSRMPFKTIAEDAAIKEEDIGRELILFVVGESARADHFSLNSYEKKTNPKLAEQQVVSFTNFWSCATSTAVSVPCMFSYYPESEFNNAKGDTTENILDVAQRTGVHVLWLDNNSDSKGVAVRIPYVSYKTHDVNPDCDIECRDEGMLSHLQKYIDEQPQGDILVVLHQMGNHGPAYFKRYPNAFGKFKPACETNQLEQCSKEEIINAYDNAILYTDHFLSLAIELLKKNNKQFETALMYVSDHGESLGEGGLYLHGMANLLAPDTQRHVPAVMWFGDSYEEMDNVRMQKIKSQRLTHDNVFHTLLGLFEMRSSSYNEKLDLLEIAKQADRQTHGEKQKN